MIFPQPGKMIIFARFIPTKLPFEVRSCDIRPIDWLVCIHSIFYILLLVVKWALPHVNTESSLEYHYYCSSYLIIIITWIIYHNHNILKNDNHPQHQQQEQEQQHED